MILLRVPSQRVASWGSVRTYCTAACRADAPVDPDVKRVLVMFKCHFDAGFIDTQANVVSWYFDKYFPKAIQTAATLRQQGNDRYVWTTGSWLIYQYLEKAAGPARQQMEQALSSGDIAWHAIPFTWQTEMLDPSLIAGGIGFSQAMDRRFGRTTTGAKMTDVTGHTRAIIGPLAEHGVKASRYRPQCGVHRGGCSARLSVERLRWPRPRDALSS